MSGKRPALGKGLSALLPDIEEATRKPVPVTSDDEFIDDGQSTGFIAHLSVDSIDSNPHQPRTSFDPETMKELADSITEKGIIQPITVRRHGARYQLVSGERRLRACKEAGLTTIPAYIVDVRTDEEMLELALIENIQREHLNPVEIAEGYRLLIEEFGYSQEEVAQKVGKDRTTVVNFIRLLNLPVPIKDSLRNNELSMGHARALLGAPDTRTQTAIWRKIIKQGLSVRRVEELVREAANRKGKPGGKKPRSLDPATESVLEQLRPVLGTKVALQTKKDGSGRLILDFYSHEDLERLLELLLSIRS